MKLIIWTPFSYGTKIALVELLDNLWQEQDGIMQPSSLFDLSAAFSTINMGILLGLD